MKIVCEECGSAYKIKDESIKGKTSIKTQCPKCKFIQKNNLIQAKEANPFQDSNKTVDFIQSINKEEVKTDLNDKKTEEIPPIVLPEIDLNTLKEEELRKSIKFEEKDVKKDEPTNTPKKEKKEVPKGLYNAKKGSSFLGPFTIDEVKEKIKKRKITKEFLFSKDGSDWASIENYKELLPFFKEFKPKSNAGKYLVIGMILILLALLTVYLLEKFNNNDIILTNNTKMENSGKKENKKNLLHQYIKKWEKNIILNSDNDTLMHSQAIQNFYQNSSDLYIKSANQFKEVLIKNNLKYDAFYYLVLTVSLAEVKIEDKKTLKDYLSILKSITNPKKHNELYYNALSALSFKLDKFVDSFNYAEKTKNILANDAIANFLLAKFYLNSKQIKKAIKHLKISIQNDDRLSISKNFLAKTFIDSELYKDAITFYEKNDTVFSKLILSKIYSLVGFHNKSLKILKVLYKNPKRLIKSDILYAKLLYQYKNKTKKALKILKDIEKKKLFGLAKKDKIQTLNHISIIYRLNNKVSKSIIYSKKILNIDPNNKYAIFNLALLRIGQKKYKEANILISQLEKNDQAPSITRKLVKLELFMAEKKYNKAIKEIKEIISLNRNNNLYYIFLASLMAKNNNLNLVQETFLSLTNINPNYHINNYYKLTDTYIKRINFTFLTNYLRASLKSKNIDKALILNNLGILEYQDKNFKKAYFYLTKSLELSNRNISTYLYLAYTNYQLKDYKKVIDIATLGLTYGKSEYLFLINLKAFLKLNQIDKAKSLIKKAKYDFEYTNNTKLMKALLLIKEGKEILAKHILDEIKDSYENDLSFKKLLLSLSK